MENEDEFFEAAEVEVGSDELLADDGLRLPEGASPLVRVHAVRAWLRRKQKECEIEMGEVALEMQRVQEEGVQGERMGRMRRREAQALAERVQVMQRGMERARERLGVYEEAGALLEECVDHTTVSERLLVEYYLSLEALVQVGLQEGGDVSVRVEALGDVSVRVEALGDVLQRVERVGMPYEED